MKFILDEGTFILDERYTLEEDAFKSPEDRWKGLTKSIDQQIKYIDKLIAIYRIKATAGEFVDKLNAANDTELQNLITEMSKSFSALDKNWSTTFINLKKVLETRPVDINLKKLLFNELKNIAVNDADEAKQLIETANKYKDSLNNIKAINIKDLSIGQVNNIYSIIMKNFPFDARSFKSVSEKKPRTIINNLVEAANTAANILKSLTANNSVATEEPDEKVETVLEKPDWKAELLKAAKDAPSNIDRVWEDAYQSVASDISGITLDDKNINSITPIVEKLKSFGERLRNSLLEQGFYKSLNSRLAYLSILYNTSSNHNKFDKLTWQAFAAIDSSRYLNDTDFFANEKKSKYGLKNIIFWTDFITRTTLDFDKYLKCQKDLSLNDVNVQEAKDTLASRYDKVTNKEVAFLFDMLGAGTSPFIKNPSATDSFDTDATKLKNENSINELYLRCYDKQLEVEAKDKFDISDPKLSAMLSNDTFKSNFNVIKWFLLQYCTLSPAVSQKAIEIAEANNINIDDKNLYPTLNIANITKLRSLFNTIDTDGKELNIFTQLVKQLGNKTTEE